MGDFGGVGIEFILHMAYFYLSSLGVYVIYHIFQK